MRHFWIVAAAVCSLSACDAVTTYGPVQSKNPIPEQQLYMAAEKGAMVAEVRGNPFPMPDARFAEMVRGYMHNAPLGPPVRFVAQPGPDTVEPYRVVVVFNAAPAAHFRGLCDYQPEPSRIGAATTMSVAMGFCFGSDQISGTWGKVNGIAGPDDPKFRELVRQTAITLVPAHKQEPESSGLLFAPQGLSLGSGAG